MLNSMTGFSSKSLVITIKEQEHAHVTLNLKSLNSRFFEATCKMPHALGHLEIDFIKKFKTKLTRGTIFFNVHIANGAVLKSDISPNISAIAGYLKSVEKIKQELPVSGSVTISDILLLPNVFDMNDEPLDQKVINIIIDAIDKLIEEVIVARQKEGALLYKDIISRIEIIETNINLIEPRSNEVIQQKRALILENFKTLITQLGQVGQEFQAESCSSIFGQVEKLDIHEEIVRFNGHLDNIKFFLNSDILEKSKRLDFILQELFREINTITAKCADSIISNLAINIKVELEKMREQVQNIV